MAFDNTQPYATVNTDAGNIYYLQGGVFYNWRDLSVAAAPPAPVDAPPSFANFSVTLDAAGNVTGVNYGQGPVTLDKQPNLNWLQWGDSGLQNSTLWFAITGVGLATQTGGVATWPATNHGSFVGETVFIVNTEDQGWYGKRTITAVIDANTLQFSVNASAAADVFPTAPTITNPTMVMSHKVGRNNLVFAAACRAGIVPSSIVCLAANTQTAKSMNVHIEWDIAAYQNYDVVFIATPGANSCRANGSAHGVSSNGDLSSAIFWAKTNALRWKATGKIVILFGWMPNNANDAGKNGACYGLDGVTLIPGTDTIAQAAVVFNSIMKDFAKRNGVYFISQYDYLTDPTSSVGYAQGTGQTSVLIADGVHIGKLGADIVADPTADLLKSLYPGYRSILPRNVNERKFDTSGTTVNPNSTQIYRNPLLTAISGTPGLAVNVITGGAFGMPAAVSYSLTPRTIAQDGDNFGFNQNVTYSTTGATSFQAGQLSFQLTPGDIVPGAQLFATCHVKISNQTLFSGLRGYLSIPTSNLGTITIELSTAQFSGSDSVVYPDGRTINEVLFTPVDVVIPANALPNGAPLFVVQGFVKAVSDSGLQAGFTLSCGRVAVYSKLNQ